MDSAADELLRQPIEFVFRFTPEEVDWIYNNGKEKRFERKQPKRLLYAGVFAFLFLAVLVATLLLFLSGVPPLSLAACVPVLGIAGYRVHVAMSAHRSVAQSRQKAYGNTNDLVFRASREVFLLRVPGVRETSVNWTALSSVRNDPPMLVLTAAQRSYFLPQRSFSAEQWERFHRFLREQDQTVTT